MSAVVFLLVLAVQSGSAQQAENANASEAVLAAAENGDLEAVKKFVEKGGDAGTADQDGYTLLHKACLQGHDRMAEYLVSKGADVNARTVFGETPLHVAKTKDIAALLISKGADVNARESEYGMTPLFFHGKDIAGLLVSKGADVNARSKSGITPLAWAVYSDSMELLQFLVSLKTDVNTSDEHGKTPLHVAANWGKTEMAEVLISRGADVNARDESGWTPLHWAAFEGTSEVISLLVKKGADKNAKTQKEWSKFPAASTPLDIAQKSGCFDTAVFLKGSDDRSGIEAGGSN